MWNRDESCAVESMEEPHALMAAWLEAKSAFGEKVSLAHLGPILGKNICLCIEATTAGSVTKVCVMRGHLFEWLADPSEYPAVSVSQLEASLIDGREIT